MYKMKLVTTTILIEIPSMSLVMKKNRLVTLIFQLVLTSTLLVKSTKYKVLPFISIIFEKRGALTVKQYPLSSLLQWHSLFLTIHAVFSRLTTYFLHLRNQNLLSLSKIIHAIIKR